MDKPSGSREELRKLYPELTEEELEQVEDSLDRYLERAIRIVERQAEEKPEADKSSPPRSN